MQSSASEPIAVIGAGFAGLSAASFLAKAGHRVVVIDRLAKVGGRAQVLRRQGFRFDMGPSWYLMPEEHDRWFRALGHRREDYYQLRRLDPNYHVFFDDANYSVPAQAAQLYELFEKIEAGAGKTLQRYLETCRSRYELAMQHFIYHQYSSPLQMLNRATLLHLRRLAIFSTYRQVVERSFHHPYLQKILSYPAVFLGSDPRHTPGVYTLMNWVDFGLGSWYPQGGFGKVVQSMRQVAEALGVRFLLQRECVALREEGRRIRALQMQPTSSVESPLSAQGPEEMAVAAVVASADYHHVEMQLLAPRMRQHNRRYWQQRRLAPSACNFYIGLDCRLVQGAHHTFFFDAPWQEHLEAVYRRPRHIDNPLFYLHVPSISDTTCAPPGGEALFALIPLAAGLEDNQQIRERYLAILSQRIAQHTGCDIQAHLRFVESYSTNDYQRDFNALRGNAFGLGHTFWQTAAFRPPNRSPRVKNLYYCGQYTVPGTGTTMSMISGELTASRVMMED